VIEAVQAVLAAEGDEAESAGYVCSTFVLPWLGFDKDFPGEDSAIVAPRLPNLKIECRDNDRARPAHKRWCINLVLMEYKSPETTSRSKNIK